MTNEMQELPLTEAQRLHKKETEAQTDLLEELVRHTESDNYIPWERTTLPSQGLYYSNKIPDGIIEVKPMGIDIDKLLTNQRIAQSGELISKIISSCTRWNPEFNIREMLSGDYNYLIYYLRGITHGNDYEFAAECAYCKTKNIYQINLSQLFETIKGPNEEFIKEPIEFKLPYLSSSFKKDVFALLKLVRVDDIMKMSRADDQIFDPIKISRASVRNRNNIKKKAPSLDISKVYENNLKSQIVGFKIDGKEMKDSRKDQIIEKLHQMDTSAIREFLDDISPGIDTIVEVTCKDPDCNKDANINVPLGEGFFGSTRART